MPKKNWLVIKHQFECGSYEMHIEESFTTKREAQEFARKMYRSRTAWNGDRSVPHLETPGYSNVVNSILVVKLVDELEKKYRPKRTRKRKRKINEKV